MKFEQLKCDCEKMIPEQSRCFFVYFYFSLHLIGMNVTKLSLILMMTIGLCRLITRVIVDLFGSGLNQDQQFTITIAKKRYPKRILMSDRLILIVYEINNERKLFGERNIKKMGKT